MLCPGSETTKPLATTKPSDTRFVPKASDAEPFEADSKPSAVPVSNLPSHGYGTRFAIKTRNIHEPSALLMPVSEVSNARTPPVDNTLPPAFAKVPTEHEPEDDLLIVKEFTSADTAVLSALEDQPKAQLKTPLGKLMPLVTCTKTMEGATAHLEQKPSDFHPHWKKSWRSIYVGTKGYFLL